MVFRAIQFTSESMGITCFWWLKIGNEGEGRGQSVYTASWKTWEVRSGGSRWWESTRDVSA